MPTHSKQLRLLNTIDLGGRTFAHFPWRATIYKRNTFFKISSEFAHTWAGVKKLRIPSFPNFEAWPLSSNVRRQFRASGHIFGTSHHKILCLATGGLTMAMALSVPFKFTVWRNLNTKSQEEGNPFISLRPCLQVSKCVQLHSTGLAGFPTLTHAC